MTFRLLTYNILRGGVGRTDALAAVINACHPDLVLLQEATDPANVEQLALATGMADGRAFVSQSLGFLSRQKVTSCQWIRPRISRHAFVEIVPAGQTFRVFGVHLSAVLAAWTEQRRLFELRALLSSIDQHRNGFHVLAGDFNTVAPGEGFSVGQLPMRLRPLMWLSGGTVRWRTIETVLHAGYADSYRALHPADPGMTLPTANPMLRLDYVFMPESELGRVMACDVVRTPPAALRPTTFRWSPISASIDRRASSLPRPSHRQTTRSDEDYECCRFRTPDRRRHSSGDIPSRCARDVRGATGSCSWLRKMSRAAEKRAPSREITVICGMAARQSP